MMLILIDVRWNKRRQGHGLGEQDAEDGSDGWAAAPPVPLFKLTPGISSTSHGIACAAVAGAKTFNFHIYFFIRSMWWSKNTDLSVYNFVGFTKLSNTSTHIMTRRSSSNLWQIFVSSSSWFVHNKGAYTQRTFYESVRRQTNTRVRVNALYWLIWRKEIHPMKNASLG